MKDLIVTILAALAILVASARGQTTRPIEDRVISILSITGEWGDSANRYIDRELLRVGWPDYAEARLWPQVNRGVKRFIILNPWGITRQGASYEFDQYIRCVDELGSRSKPAWGFAGVMRSMTRHAEVIIYIGGPTAQGTAQQQFDYFEAAVRPIISNGCSVGLDATSLIPDTSPGFYFACSLRARGIKVYGEGYPELKRPAWAELPTFLMPANLREAEKQLATTQPAWHPVQKIDNETIVFVPLNGDPKPYLDRGFSVAMEIREKLLASRKTLREFMGADPRMIED